MWRLLPRAAARNLGEEPLRLRVARDLLARRAVSELVRRSRSRCRRRGSCHEVAEAVRRADHAPRVGLARDDVRLAAHRAPGGFEFGRLDIDGFPKGEHGVLVEDEVERDGWDEDIQYNTTQYDTIQYNTITNTTQ